MMCNSHVLYINLKGFLYRFLFFYNLQPAIVTVSALLTISVTPQLVNVSADQILTVANATSANPASGISLTVRDANATVTLISVSRTQGRVSTVEIIQKGIIAIGAWMDTTVTPDME